MTELWNYERYELPVQRGGRYFYPRNDGLQNQSVLYVADGLQAQPRVLLDPNTLSKDATIALGEIVPSPDGKVLAYSLSDGGSDWRTWHFRDVATGTDLPDVLRFIKFANVSGPQIRARSTTRAIRCARTAPATTASNAKSTGTRWARRRTRTSACSRSSTIRRATRTCRFPTTSVT